MWVDLWMVGFFIAILAACDGGYDSRLHSPIETRDRCHADLPIILGLAISDFLTDLMVLFLPVYPVSDEGMLLTEPSLIKADFAAPYELETQNGRARRLRNGYCVSTKAPCRTCKL